jgi:threonyl-tRNA synthetase
MAAAVKRLYPDAKLGIGPAIENGFYYDFEIPGGLKEEDLQKIEDKMKEIVKENLPFVRKEISSVDAEALFEKTGEKFKVELVKDLNGQVISIYSNGDFTDLCRGPHVASTGDIKYFKLLSVSGAYWRGIEANAQLARIYGTAFFSQKELDEYIKVLEESKKRDHRTLGRGLDLYSITDTVGAGLVLWHPAGGRLRTIIEDFWRKEHYKNGYELVYSPHIGKASLWETSGHLDFYRENMYAAMEIDNQEYFVKPMNCPFHIMMYKSRQWSYRELPLRWAELGTVYRYEKSGVLHGLLRVRGFTQDDAHLICRPDQMPEEIRRVLRFCLYMLKSFGFENFQICLATKPKEKSVGDEASWQAGTEALKQAVTAEGLAYEIDEGGGAFYGPKIDIKIKDALGRAWQCSTIQFDFNLPERFDMSFSGADNQKQRPYMIHRALLGSLERFMGVLIEHYAGKFPLWLAPVQVCLINIGDDTADYANSIKEKLLNAGLRVEADLSGETLQKKIRNAETAKVPYMFILGKKEKESGQVSLRKQGSKNMGSMSLDGAIKLLQEEAAEKNKPL